MVPETELDIAAIRREALDFRCGFKTVVLATSSIDGEPEASYTPCVMDNEGRIYIYISRLARHTRHLLSNRRASLLWIENEEAARNLFARRRLSLECDATEVSRGSEQAEQILDQMEQELDKTVSVLRTLGDFHLFRLTPAQGVYVQGFGKAFDVSGPALEIENGPKGL